VFEAERIVRALDVVTGNELWRFVPDTTADFAHSVVDERAFYIGTRSGMVHALDVATGHRFWAVSPLQEIRYVAHVQAITTHGDTVYVAIEEDTSPTGHLLRGWIVALDRYTGAVYWRYVNERIGEPHDASYPTVAGHVLLVNDRRGGAFFGVDRFTGKEFWRYTGPSDRYGGADFFQIADGIAYLASLDAYAYAIDPETGRILWKTDVKGSAHSSAVCGDHLFVGAGVLYKLRRSDGKVEAIYFADEWGYVGREFITSRLLAHEGRLYFVTNAAVYAVECD
jgi:outer membrane protein assembly factor BamB